MECLKLAQARSDPLVLRTCNTCTIISPADLLRHMVTREGLVAQGNLTQRGLKGI